MLALNVRAAAAASNDEAEFVRRLRRQDLIVRPRYAQGTTDVVAGYSVAERPTQGERPIWYGGGNLGRDLTLPRLRSEWPDSVESSTAANAEWAAAMRGRRVVSVGREASTPSPADWQRSASDLEQLVQKLRVCSRLMIGRHGCRLRERLPARLQRGHDGLSRPLVISAMPRMYCLLRHRRIAHPRSHQQYVTERSKMKKLRIAFGVAACRRRWKTRWLGPHRPGGRPPWRFLMSSSTASRTSKVTWSFTASLDGFITGPGHDMAWLEACPRMDGSVVARLAADVGVILSGRRGYDAAREQADQRDELTAEAYGGAWEGIEIVLTHRPAELADDSAVTAWNVDVAGAGGAPGAAARSGQGRADHQCGHRSPGTGARSGRRAPGVLRTGHAG